jgi:hypothetical protein
VQLLRDEEGDGRCWRQHFSTIVRRRLAMTIWQVDDQLRGRGLAVWCE